MITLADILNPKNWKAKHFFSQEESASTIKYVEKEASRIHTIIKKLNDVLVNGKYIVHTSIVSNKKETHYTLTVDIYYYANKKKHKHKENSHKQKVNI